jgi:hypothetical protein
MSKYISRAWWNRSYKNEMGNADVRIPSEILDRLTTFEGLFNMSLLTNHDPAFVSGRSLWRSRVVSEAVTDAGAGERPQGREQHRPASSRARSAEGIGRRIDGKSLTPKPVSTYVALDPGVPDPPGTVKVEPCSKSRHRLREEGAVHAKSVLGGLHHEHFLAPRAAS